MLSLPSFSAVLMAGGRSMRMGRDKALLPISNGQLLWQRQLDVLRALQPRSLYWSGPVRPGVPDDVHPVSDAVADAGPLAGLSACLDVVRDDLLVVLAVDLARMETLYLQQLLAGCRLKQGVVAHRDGYFEPLAAVYPKSLAPLAAEHLHEGRHALQDFIRRAVDLGMMTTMKASAEDARYFANFNTPDTTRTL